MIEKFLSYVSFTSVIVFFLYICGGLYLICYWSNFGIEIYDKVGITEIPKSFLRPLSFTVIIAIILFFILFYVSKVLYQRGEQFSKTRRIVSNYKYLSEISSLGLVSLLILVPIFFPPFRHEPIFLWPTGLAFGFLIFIRVALSKRFRKEFKKVPGIYLLLFCTMVTPLISAVMGFVDGADVYTNRRMNKINAIFDNTNMRILPANDSISLKYLGFLGDKLIVSSLDNEKIFMINQSSIKTIDVSFVKPKSSIRQPRPR